MSRRLRWLLISLTAVAGLIALIAASGYVYLRGSLPQTTGRITLPALDDPVRVTRDDRGIATIEAQNLADAYTALGFIHAQDRLFQLELTRRVAQGRLAELVGEPVLSIDTFMRVLGFGARAERQLAQLSQPTRDALASYADGVNAFLDTDPVLPLEFQILRHTPAPWRAEDSLAWLHLMALQLSGNWREEIERARVAEKLAPQRFDVLYGDGASAGAPTIDRIKHARGLPLQRLADALPWELQPKSASNAWALNGAETGDGRAILANDPHLGLRAPGYWYLARIETPQRTIVGATAPGVPFTVLGRNRNLAWGLTTTHSDTQDLFIEKLAEGNQDRYVTPNGTRAFDVRTETIEVAGREEPKTLRVRSTRHGPVISDAVDSAETMVAGQDKVIALAWPGIKGRDRTLDAIRGVNMAGDVESALTALDLVGSPQQNVFLADESGRIAVAAPGHVPVRKRGDGTMPRPGWKAAYDWQGLIPLDALPRTVDPASDRIVNANNKLVPADYPYQIAETWPPPFRAERIRRLLDEAGDQPDLDTMAEIQLDVHTPASDILLPELLAHGARTSRGETAIRMLRDWNGHMDREKPEPLIFVAWMDTLNRKLLADELGELFGEFRQPEPRRLLRILKNAPDFCDNVETRDITETCPDQVQIALEQALTDLADAYGNDLESWAWGDAHRAKLPHPALSRIPVLGGVFTNPVATSGGDETVNRGGATYSGESPGERYAHVHGPGLRALHDLSKPPSSSRFMIADGQSGNPLSPHYAGMAEAWRGGRYVKLVGETQEEADVLRLTPVAR
jgi:penicillin amidase